jgi:hypothetical protein
LQLPTPLMIGLNFGRVFAVLFFVPTVLVPFWLILHAVIWAQLRRHTKFSHPANAVA